MSDWETALRDHHLYAGSFEPAFWSTYLREHPEVLHHILADLHTVAGINKGRPADLDDLWELVAPRYSEKAFSEAFTEAMNGRSLRQIAASISLSHTSISRYLSGAREVINPQQPIESMRRLELIAKGLGVQPAYFIEWRRLWVMSVIDSALELHPNVSISIYQKFSGKRSKPVRGTHAARVFLDEGVVHGTAR